MFICLVLSKRISEIIEQVKLQSNAQLSEMKRIGHLLAKRYPVNVKLFAKLKNIYLISRLQYKKGSDPKYSKHKLYKITKKDGTVLELFEWDKGNSFVKSIHFTSNDNGIVLFRPSGNPLDYQVLKTNNGGLNWAIENINSSIGISHIFNGNLYLLSQDRKSKKGKIYSFDKETNSRDSVIVGLPVVDFNIDKDGGIWLLGKHGKQTVLQYHHKGKVENVKIFSEDSEFSPNQLYKYNDVIVVLASQIDQSLLGGFGGTKPIMYLSKDNGTTWDKQLLKGALYLNPISFYKDEKMIAYLGLGKVLICNFN